MTDPDSARSVDSIGAAQRTDSLRLDGLALSLCGLALAASLAALGWLPAWSLPWCAGPALLATAALPLLVRWSPRPADMLQLAAFTLALSPLFATSIFAAWQLVFDARQALALCAATCGVLHLASLQGRVRTPQPGRAVRLIALLAVALAAALGWLLLRGNEPRLIEPALTRASVALALDRSLPPLHPWLAGERWSKVWSADLLAVVVEELQVWSDHAVAQAVCGS